MSTCVELAEKLPVIPAMTTDAERECFYLLARDGAHRGTVVELGAWLGASSAWIAAGVRDSGVPTKAKVYDRFESKPGHIAKIKAFHDKEGINEPIVGPCLQAFKDNLGPLLKYVEPNKCEIGGLQWGGGPVSVLICDAPKRVREISSVLTTFRKALQPGSIMAWQDFCHFPSYEIPACLFRLWDHIDFVEAVVPGTTMVFRVRSQWSLSAVSMATLDLGNWTAEEIASAWAYWRPFVAPEKRSLFDCGEVMFLCDLDRPNLAVTKLAAVFERDAHAIVKKWRYLKEARPDFLTRYAPLFQYLESQGAL